MFDKTFFTRRSNLTFGLAGVALAVAAFQAPSAGANPAQSGPLATVTPSAGGAARGSGATASNTEVVSLFPVQGGPSTQAPTLSPISVQVGGTEATLSFTSSEPVAATVSLQPSSSASGASQILNPGPTGSTSGPISDNRPPVTGGRAGIDIPPANFEASHQIPLRNLTSNTAYEATISGRTRGGTPVTGHVQFHTAKLRVAITLQTIDIIHDGATYGDNTVQWSFGVTWGGYPHASSGQTSFCFPQSGYDHPNVGVPCQDGSYPKGTFHPLRPDNKLLTWVFAEENFDRFPTTFTVSGVNSDDDVFTGLPGDSLTSLLGASFTDGCSDAPDESTWTLPVGLEQAQRFLFTCALDPDSPLISKLFFSATLFFDDNNYPAVHNMPTDPWAAH
jgi:hypothetical protein